MGYFAAFGFILLLIIGIYCFGYAARKSSLLYILLLETVFGLIIIFPILIVVEGLAYKEIVTKPTSSHYMWLATASLLGFTGGNYFSLLNLKTVGEKINSLLSPTITAFTVLLSYFFLSEKLLPIQWIGVIVTLTVIFYFLLKDKTKTASEKSMSQLGWWSSLATILCIALSIIFSIKGASESISFLHAIAIRLFFAFITISLAFIITQTHKRIAKQNLFFYIIVLIGVLAQTIGASYLWFYATFQIGISVLQVIIASLPIWVYAIDIYILKKSNPSPAFIITSLLAGLGIYLVMHPSV